MRYLALLTLLAAGCADRAAFRPTENVAALGYGGQPAASYQIRAEPDAEPHATVAVWSRGAERKPNATFIDMMMSVRNTGDRPIVVDQGALRLEAHTNKGTQLPNARLVAITEPRGLWIQPGDARDIRMRFAIPAAVDPDRIGGFRLRWGLEHHGGQQYVQFTEFRRERDQYVSAGYVSYYHPIYGFYDPFWYPHSFHYRAPVQRVIVVDRNRPPRTVIRDRTTRR